MSDERQDNRAASGGEPISWLELELYRLGELDPARRASVERRLERSAEDRACLELIDQEGDLQLRPLPAAAPRSARRRWPRVTWAAIGAGLAAAAAAAVIALSVDPTGPPGSALPGRRIGFKGGELAVALVAERGGAILRDPTGYLPADRLKLLLTCPGDARLRGEVIVFQEGGAGFPFRRLEEIECGNRRPLPGAFRITGRSAATICLVVSEKRLPRRERLRRAGPRGLPRSSVCLRLSPLSR